MLSRSRALYALAGSVFFVLLILVNKARESISPFRGPDYIPLQHHQHDSKESEPSSIWREHQSLVHNKSQPRTFLLLPITHPSLGFCQSLYTALLQGYSPILLNWGHDLPPAWKIWDQKVLPDRMSKIRKTADWLNAEGNLGAGWRVDDVVIIADATDLWYQVHAFRSCDHHRLRPDR